jgi:carbonic anhydrase/acetyltransferase-like protein (isoleucine patch superfamily)
MKLETGQNGSIITFNGITPKIHPSAFICEGVKIIGDVVIEEDVSIWYNTVIRGDVNFIRIGKRTNIQDVSMLHVTNKKHPLILGENVSIAHSVSLHGATLHDGCLVGIGAIVLDGSIIGKHSFIAAGALVREGFVVPEGVLVAGVPGKIVRDLTPAELERISSTTTNYMGYVDDYRQQLLSKDI